MLHRSGDEWRINVWKRWTRAFQLQGWRIKSAPGGYTTQAEWLSHSHAVVVGFPSKYGRLRRSSAVNAFCVFAGPERNTTPQGKLHCSIAEQTNCVSLELSGRRSKPFKLVIKLMCEGVCECVCVCVWARTCNRRVCSISYAVWYKPMLE